MINIQYFWGWVNKFNPRIAELEKQNIDLILQDKLLNDEKSALLQEIKNLNDNTELDKYCKKHYKLIPPIAYKQKREINSKYYSIALQELITPEAYEVRRFFKSFDFDVDNYQIAQKVGKKVSNFLEWTDDKNLSTSGDYYLMPSETIALTKGDCEDLTYICCSAHKEIGGCWGFWRGNGHAFNCFSYLGELYILDTVGDSAVIKKYSEQGEYVIHFIITRKDCYQVLEGTNFGTIAEW